MEASGTGTTCDGSKALNQMYFLALLLLPHPRAPLNTEVMYILNMPLPPLTKASSCIHEFVDSVCFAQASMLVPVLAC